MTRLGVAALLASSLLAGLLSGCGDATPPTDPASSDALLVRVDLASTTLHPGEGVPLTVTRAWPKDHEPAPFDDALLAPFVLRAERIVRQGGAKRIEETRHYRAYAFSLEDVTIPALVFGARAPDGETVRLAQSEPVVVSIRPVLDPKNPGPPEGPGLRVAPGAPLWLLVLALLVLGFEVVALRARRARVRDLQARREAPLRRLRALQARASTQPAVCRADLAAAFEAVRDALATEGVLAAGMRTTEEITAALVGARGEAWRGLVAAAGIDLVKFAKAPVTPERLANVLERASEFVRADVGEGRS